MAVTTEHMHLELYERFASVRVAADATGQLMPYHWTAMPERLHAVWMAYSAMLEDFARELANSINAFTLSVRRLSAWGALPDMPPTNLNSEANG